MEEVFLKACARGDLVIVKALLAQGCLPNGKRHRDSAENSQILKETPLTISAHMGHHDVVRQLIACCAYVDSKNFHGLTALHIASGKGHMKIVKTLLKAHAKIDEVDMNRSTSLIRAACEGHHKVVGHLIACNADVGRKNLNFRTALHVASERGHMEVVKALVRAHAEIDEVDIGRSTPLMLAALNGHQDVVGHLIASGGSIDKKGQHNRTALHYASERGNLEVVKVLLNAGAKIDVVDDYIFTPLMLATHINKRADIISCLLYAEMIKQDVSTLTCIPSGSTLHKVSITQLSNTKLLHPKSQLSRDVLSYAINQKYEVVAKALITHGVGIEGLLSTSPPMTALMLTAQEGDYSLTEQLLLQGVNMNYHNPDGHTALHLAARRGQLEVVQILLINGAEIDLEDKHHHTPLVLSVEARNYDVMLHLITSGADVRQLAKHPDRELGRDALSYAIKSKHIYIDAAKVLIAQGVGIEGLLSTSPPMTALMWTAQEGYDSLTEELVRKVNVNYQNPDGHTALQFAAHSGRLEIVRILLNNGAEIDLEDIHHHTPLVLSVEAKKYDVMLHLITSGANVTQLAQCTYPVRDHVEALSYAVNHKHKEAAKGLIASGVGIEGLLSTSPAMTALMWTAQEGYDSLTKQLILQGVNFKYQNPDGSAALHFAAHSGQLEVVNVLLNKGAEIDLEDNHHHTPLVLSIKAKKYDVMLHLITSGADVTKLAKHPERHLGREALSYAINYKYKETAKVMINKGISTKGLLSTSPPMTTLMWIAQEGDDSLTRQLILEGVNVNYQNPSGDTALHFATRTDHIQCGILLAEAGADVGIVNKTSQAPLDLSSSEFKDAILQTLSFRTKKTVCIIGDAMSGKSTLIASLKNENAWFWMRIRNWLFGVQEISERTAGIEPVSLRSKRYGDVMFFDFAGQHEYHGPHEMFLESILSKGLSTVTIIVVVKATEEESAICHQLNRWLHPFAKMSSAANPVRAIVIGSHMDKVIRKVEAKEKLELCYKNVKDSLRDVPVKFEDLCYLDCRQPYSSDILKLCKCLKDVPPPQYKDVHIGYSIPWVISRIRSSINEKVISMSEFSEWIAYNKANLPTNLPPAEEVCKDLSSTGHFLYIPSKEVVTVSNGWLVLDLPSILHEVYGTLFSPSKKIVNKFGLLNCQRLSVLFPTLDPSMICDVLISLEFCIEVDPSILSESTHLMDSSDEGHEHLFFPALVSAKPPIVFNEECKGIHILCWQLEVKENFFLSPRLLQTIILRFAAHYVFHHKRGSETRQHYCKVWWNGIFWQSTDDVDLAVQISNNAVVQVIGRSAVSSERVCMYMSTIIQDIFGTIHDLSPSLEGTMYIIHPVNPQALLENPRSSSPREMFPVDVILESKRKGGSTCLSCNVKDKIAERKDISDVFGSFEPSVDVIERFSMSAYPPPPANQLTESTTSTDSFLSASSDPLPTMLDDPLRTTPTDPLLNTSDDPLSRPSEADSDPPPTTSGDPLKTTSTDPLLTTPTINELQRLVIRHIALEWQSIGLELDIEVSVLQIIEEDNPRSVERCCRTMFTRWLVCDEGTGGEPRVWRTVLKALKYAGYKTVGGDVERALSEQK